MSHPFISRLLQKFKVSTVQELSPDDQATIRNYELALSVEEVTVDSIKTFCETQVKKIETIFASGDNTDKKDSFLKATLFVYLSLLKIINEPQAEKERVEKQLLDILNQ